MLHNIDDHRSIASVRVAEWKLSRGSSSGGQWDGWYGPSGREPGLSYDVDAGWNVKKLWQIICMITFECLKYRTLRFGFR